MIENDPALQVLEKELYVFLTGFGSKLKEGSAIKENKIR